MTYDAARTDLEKWRRAYPADPFDADTGLREELRRYLDDDRLVALSARAGSFARDLVSVVAPAAARYEQRAHLPELVKYDGLGRRVERVSFDPSYHVAGDAVWRSGLVELSKDPGGSFEQMTLLYLLSAEGEAGHACPATCTIGLARALRRRATPEVRERFLPPLVDPSYEECERGAQFLTEVQGGSDVGANASVAVATGDGTYRISGEKWFCSVADADQFFITARVSDAPGTRGLGSFVIPREIDGTPNGFAIRRLKDKMGTRGLASGEIDFDGALAWPVGPLEEGFRTAVGVVLNTSRWMTATGSAGIMRRAVVEARNFATYRRAFGRPIEEFPVVQRTIAEMTATWRSALALVAYLTDLEDRLDRDVASEHETLVHRFLVNATKLVVSQQATRVVRSAIEVLGGNGTIEEFSVLPRLYRDAIVYESWEGTHNVLAAQVLNDVRRLPILEAMQAVVREHDELTGTVLGALESELRVMGRSREDDDLAGWSFRESLESFTSLFAAVVAGGAVLDFAATQHRANRVDLDVVERGERARLTREVFELAFEERGW